MNKNIKILNIIFALQFCCSQFGLNAMETVNFRSSSEFPSLTYNVKVSPLNFSLTKSNNKEISKRTPQLKLKISNLLIGDIHLTAKQVKHLIESHKRAKSYSKNSRTIDFVYENWEDLEQDMQESENQNVKHKISTIRDKILKADYSKI